jgi:multidrug resistance efflux pump
MIRNKRIEPGTGFAKTKSSTAIHLVQCSRKSQSFARFLIVGLFLSIIAMGVLPWQQTSRGTGQVVAFIPQDRMQPIEAPSEGVVARIGMGLKEGSYVEKGQFLLEISPFAANERSQLEEQSNQVNFKLAADRNKKLATMRMVNSYERALEFTVSSANEMIKMAEAKLKAKEELIPKYETEEWQARTNFERQRGLASKGVKPAREVEILEAKWQSSLAMLKSLDKEIESLKNEVQSKTEEREAKREKAQADVDYANSLVSEVESKISATQKEFAEIEVKLGKMDRFVVNAPRDGTILRMPIYELGQTLKKGQSLMTLVPQTDNLSVELAINGNDLPLVQIGQEVRLQFEGWPAVQFAGWPSVAVGTFGGTVATVDATDNGKGSFRILVQPELKQVEGEWVSTWPEERFLRQGVRANGWVMMKQVKLGYEIWRQLNGFPVMLDEAPAKKSSDSKPPKIPK